jgi:hypothetical protein
MPIYNPSGGTSTQPDIPLTITAQTVNETVTAGYSAVVVRQYTVALGTVLSIQLGAHFRIL